MKKTVLILTNLLATAIVSLAQVTSFNDCENVGNPAHFAFQNGESITLVANYKWGLVNTNVGEATMKLSKEDYNNQIHYVAMTNIKTYGFFDTFFKVRDSFVSKFNADNLKPSYFHQDTQEGKYTKTSTMTFDWNEKKVSGKKQRKKAPEKEFTTALKDCTFDFLTFVYYLRNINFDAMPINSNLSVTFALDEKLHNLTVRYLGNERVETKAGKFNSVKISVQMLESETFASEPEMILYLSKDKNHIPLYMEMPLKIGKVRISLSDYSNLKYPVNK